MAVKQNAGSNAAPDGSQYVTMTDGAGNLVGVSTGNAAVTATTASDAVTTANSAQITQGYNYLFNGTTWDRTRSVGGASQTTTTGMIASVNTPHAAATSGIVPVVSAATEGNHILKASPGNLYQIVCQSGASAGFLLIHNTITAPGDGAVTPIMCLPVAANSSVAYTPVVPLRGSTGLTAVFSTTGPFTQTTSATAYFSALVV